MPGQISIHALLAESDREIFGISHSAVNFYPRSPCGERLLGRVEVVRRMLFLSTLSLRRATNRIFHVRSFTSISIHALLAESDVRDCWKQGFVTVFLSTLSLRRATSAARMLYQPTSYFYPRSPCGERLLGRVEVV